MMNNALFWKDHGRIKVGTKSKSKDLCDDNGIMWLEQVVLSCPICGKFVRDYIPNIVSYNYCPQCREHLIYREEQGNNE